MLTISSKRFQVNVSLAHLLNHIRVKPYNELVAEYSSLMGIPSGEYEVTYSYRFEYPEIKKVETLPDNLTVLDFLKIVAVGFESCYGIHFKDTGSCVVPPMHTDWEVQLKQYKDGVEVGGCVSTPFFEIIDVDLQSKSISLWMGT